MAITVVNLSRRVNAADLEEIFSGHQISKIIIETEADGCIASVQLENEAEEENAIEQLIGTRFRDNYPITHSSDPPLPGRVTFSLNSSSSKIIRIGDSLASNVPDGILHKCCP